jgi:hypothetical protein
MSKWKVVSDTGKEMDLDRRKSSPVAKSTFTATGKAKVSFKPPVIPPHIPHTLYGGWVFSGFRNPKTAKGTVRWYYLSDEHPGYTLILAPDHKFVVVKGSQSAHFNPSMEGKATFLMSAEEKEVMRAGIEKAKREDISFWWRDKEEGDQFDYEEEDPNKSRWDNGNGSHGFC